MLKSQDPLWRAGAPAPQTERLGALPLINHFLERLGLEGQLEHFVPTADRRIRLPYAKGLGVLLRPILVEREPMYRQQETVSSFSPEAFGLDEASLGYVGDDAVGRALDHLFDADRGTLLTEVVVGAVQPGEQTFSTSLTPSCVPASPWTTSMDAVDASCV